MSRDWILDEGVTELDGDWASLRWPNAEIGETVWLVYHPWDNKPGMTWSVVEAVITNQTWSQTPRYMVRAVRVAWRWAGNKEPVPEVAGQTWVTDSRHVCRDILIGMNDARERYKTAIECYERGIGAAEAKKAEIQKDIDAFTKGKTDLQTQGFDWEAGYRSAGVKP